MGGFHQTTGREKAYNVLLLLTFFSMILILPLFIGYMEGVIRRNKKKNSSP
jgi:hypothetical protein